MSRILRLLPAAAACSFVLLLSTLVVPKWSSERASAGAVSNAGGLGCSSFLAEADCPPRSSGCFWSSDSRCHDLSGRKIVLVVADDMRADHGPLLSESDAFYAATPNLNRLHKRGVSYRRAYCQFPLCGPSRQSFLSGRSPESLRQSPDDLTPFGFAAVEGFRSFALPHLMQRLGYRTWEVGKVAGLEGLGSNARLSEHAGRTLGSQNKIDGAKGADAGLRRHYCARSAALRAEDCPNAHAGCSVCTDSVKVDSFVREVTTTSSGWRDPLSKQFAVIGFNRPHGTFSSPAFAKEMQPALPHPALERDVRSPVSDRCIPFLALQNHLPAQGCLNSTWAEGGEWGAERVATFLLEYHASVTLVDHELGRVMDVLDDVAPETVVVFFSDHGVSGLENRNRGKANLFENTLRVPLIVASPFHPETHGVVVSALASLLDIVPTVLELAGVSAADRAEHYALDGVSLVPTLRAKAAPLARGAAEISSLVMRCGFTTPKRRPRLPRPCTRMSKLVKARERSAVQGSSGLAVGVSRTFENRTRVTVWSTLEERGRVLALEVYEYQEDEAGRTTEGRNRGRCTEASHPAWKFPLEADELPSGCKLPLPGSSVEGGECECAWTRRTVLPETPWE